MPNSISRWLPIFAFAFISREASAQLRIVTMNTSNSAVASSAPRSGMDTILSAIGSTVSDDPTIGGPNTGIARKIDVLCLQEFNAPGTTGAQFAALMNSNYGTTSYSYGTLAGSTTGSGTQGVIYNTATVQLIDSKTVGTSSTSGEPRQALRYQFRPVGYSSSADFYIYNSHYKAGNDADSASRRLDEASAIHDNAGSLGSGTRIIYLGDFNTYYSAEAGYQKLLSAGNGQAFDPINQSGTWTNNAAFLSIHTQSPWDSNIGSSGFTGGGMDDRFDQQLVSAAVNDRHGFAYIPNSYQAFGNNGTHHLNQSIDTGSGASPAVLTAEASILDHLPVVADYQLPSKMSVAVGSVPAQVIVGANVSVNATVTNSAPVAIAIGADGLDYSLTSSGSLSGSGSGSQVPALSVGNTHALTFDTTSVGLKTGTISVNATSQETASASFSQGVSTQVIDHSQPSLDGASALNVATIDFGIKGRTLGGGTASFAIYNRQGNGTTAGLDLDSINATGSTGQLTTSAVPFTNLAALSNQMFVASLNASSNGTLNATYTFNVSDQDLPGATTRGPLTLVIKGIVATPGDTDLNNQIDGGDYAHIDTTFGNESTFGNIGGWSNGDFNGDGQVDGADYALIDFYFSSQTGSLARALAFVDGNDPSQSGMNTGALQLLEKHLGEFGEGYRAEFLAAVPEPASVVMVGGIVATSMLNRRRHGHLSQPSGVA